MLKSRSPKEGRIRELKLLPLPCQFGLFLPSALLSSFTLFFFSGPIMETTSTFSLVIGGGERGGGRGERRFPTPLGEGERRRKTPLFEWRRDLGFGMKKKCCGEVKAVYIGRLYRSGLPRARDFPQCYIFKTGTEKRGNFEFAQKLVRFLPHCNRR